MKAKYIFSALTTAFCLVALPACAKTTGAGRLPTPTSYTVQPTVTSAVTQPPTPTPSRELDPSVLQKEPVAGTGLYRLTGLSFSPSDFFLTENALLVSLNTGDLSMEEPCVSENIPPLVIGTIDLKTGAVKEYTLPYASAGIDPSSEFLIYTLYPLGDGFLLTEESQGLLALLDASFRIQDETVIASENYLSVYKQDKNHLVAWSYPSNDYHVISIDDNQKLHVETRQFFRDADYEVTGLLELSEDNRAVLCVAEYSDEAEAADSVLPESYVLLDLASGQYSPLPINVYTNVFLRKDCIILNDYYKDCVSVYTASEPTLERTFPIEENAIFQDITDEYIRFSKEDYDAGTASLYTYSYETGALLSVLTYPTDCKYVYIAESADFGSTTFFLAPEDDMHNALFFGEAQAAEPSEPFSALFARKNYEYENTQLAARIQREFSIPVFIGKDAIRHTGSYFTVAENDSKTINHALNTLYDFLAAFPDGFFPELLNAAYDFDTIEIYLTADIKQIPDSFNTLTTAGGFVVTVNRVKSMTVDITDFGYRKTFAHEFMHIIEDVMYQKCFADDREYEVFQRFSQLNPKGFDYLYSYENYYGSPYSSYCGSNWSSEDDTELLDSIYFIDDYSLTYASEDLARLFETLVFTSEKDVPAYFRSRPIQQKAAYLCACIRDSFDCISEEDEPFWERLLTERLSLDYFKEHYPLESD